MQFYNCFFFLNDIFKLYLHISLLNVATYGETFVRPKPMHFSQKVFLNSLQHSFLELCDVTKSPGNTQDHVSVPPLETTPLKRVQVPRIRKCVAGS